MSGADLAGVFRAVLLRHSRSLVDHDGEPTEHLLAELVAVAERHAAEQTPTPVRPGRPRKREDAAEDVA